MFCLFLCTCTYVVDALLQFQVEVFSTKKYNCRCTKCGHRFTQNVQKASTTRTTEKQ